MTALIPALRHDFAFFQTFGRLRAPRYPRYRESARFPLHVATRPTGPIRFRPGSPAHRRGKNSANEARERRGARRPPRVVQFSRVRTRTVCFPFKNKRPSGRPVICAPHVTLPRTVVARPQSPRGEITSIPVPVGNAFNVIYRATIHGRVFTTVAVVDAPLRACRHGPGLPSAVVWRAVRAFKFDADRPEISCRHVRCPQVCAASLPTRRRLVGFP